MNKDPFKENFERLSSIITRILPDIKKESANNTDEIQKHWNELIGNPLNKHTFPEKLQKGTLTILVDHSSWLQELNLYCKPYILKTLQEKWPQIKKLRFRIGIITPG